MKVHEILSENKESTKKLTRGELATIVSAVQFIWDNFMTRDVAPPKYKEKLDSGKITTADAVKTVLNHIVDSNGQGGGSTEQAFKILDARLRYWELVPQIVKALPSPLKNTV